MTLTDKKITKDQFFNICLKLELTTQEILAKIQHIRKVLKDFGKKIQCFNGKGLVSMILPNDFIYDKKNNVNPEEPVVKIVAGVMIEGTVDKSILGSSHNSIIQVLNKEYSSTVASRFVDGIQFVTNEWLLIEAFTIGIKDCLMSKEDCSKEQEIKDVIEKCLMEAESVKATTTHPGIREMRVNTALGKAKDIGLRIAKDALATDNNFLSTVKSGSKGDFFNIAQITGLLGQQNLKGERIPLLLNNGRRSLVHYPFKIDDLNMEYESRGFISSSFSKGLNPREFFFHAMSGREGISDTACGTATSGYVQRRIVKLTEDIQIKYDGTVRDSTGKIFQFVYGEDGYDPSNTVKVEGNQEAVDISRLVDKLNYSYKIKK